VHDAVQHLLLSGDLLSDHLRTGCRRLDSTMYRLSCGFLAPKLRISSAMTPLQVVYSMSAVASRDCAPQTRWRIGPR
jgi:hypothetical protein